MRTAGRFSGICCERNERGAMDRTEAKMTLFHPPTSASEPTAAPAMSKVNFIPYSEPSCQDIQLQ